MRPVGLVTGAARGIGASMAKQFALQRRAMMAVDGVCVDRALPYPMVTPQELAALTGDQVVSFVADVRDVDAHDRWDGSNASITRAVVIAGDVLSWEMALDKKKATL